MSRVRYDSVDSRMAPRTPCWRGSGPRDAISSSLIPDVRKLRKPPSPSGRPSAAYRAPASSRALSTRRCSTSSTESSAATASTASLTALSVGLRDSAIDRTIRAGWAIRTGRDTRSSRPVTRGTPDGGRIGEVVRELVRELGLCDIAPITWKRCGCGASMKLVKSKCAITPGRRRSSTRVQNASSNGPPSAIASPRTNADSEAAFAPRPTTGSIGRVRRRPRSRTCRRPASRTTRAPSGRPLPAGCCSDRRRRTTPRRSARRHGVRRCGASRGRAGRAPWDRPHRASARRRRDRRPERTRRGRPRRPRRATASGC